MSEKLWLCKVAVGVYDEGTVITENKSGWIDCGISVGGTTIQWLHAPSNPAIFGAVPSRPELPSSPEVEGWEFKEYRQVKPGDSFATQGGILIHSACGDSPGMYRWIAEKVAPPEDVTANATGESRREKRYE